MTDLLRLEFAFPVQSLPAADHALEVGSRTGTSEVQERRFAFGSGHSRERPDLCKRDFAVSHGLGDLRELLQGQSGAESFPCGVGFDADAPGQPLGSGGEAGALPAAPAVELGQELHGLIVECVGLHVGPGATLAQKKECVFGILGLLVFGLVELLDILGLIRGFEVVWALGTIHALGFIRGRIRSPCPEIHIRRMSVDDVQLRASFLPPTVRGFVGPVHGLLADQAGRPLDGMLPGQDRPAVRPFSSRSGTPVSGSVQRFGGLRFMRSVHPHPLPSSGVASGYMKYMRGMGGSIPGPRREKVGVPGHRKRVSAVPCQIEAARRAVGKMRKGPR